MFDFLRDDAERIYLNSGNNKKGNKILKVGYTSDIEKRAKSYQSSANDSDDIYNFNRKGDKVDEVSMKIFMRSSKKGSVDSYSRSEDIDDWNPWTNKQDPWFEDSPELKDIFKTSTYDEIYSEIDLNSWGFEDLELLSRFSFPIYDPKALLRSCILCTIRTKKCVTFCRALFIQNDRDVDKFYKHPHLHMNLASVNYGISRFFKDKNKQSEIEFRKLYIQLLTAYKEEIRFDLEDKLLSMIGDC